MDQKGSDCGCRDSSILIVPMPQSVPRGLAPGFDSTKPCPLANFDVISFNSKLRLIFMEELI